jgi:hypothetical protein
MDFIDWDGNGQIDPVDIGISISLEEDDDSPPPKPPNNSGGGCLAVTIAIMGVVTLVTIIIVGVI